MKWIFPLSLLVSAMLAPLAAQDDFASVQKTFDSQHGEIDTAYRADLVKLKEQLVAALGKNREAVKRSGDLDAVKVLDAELARWKDEGDLPLVEPDHPEIAKLYQVYRTAEAGRLLRKQRAIVAWFQAYDTRLTALEKQLVAADKIEDAEAVRSERDTHRESMELSEAREAVKAADLPDATGKPAVPGPAKSWFNLKGVRWKKADGGQHFMRHLDNFDRSLSVNGRRINSRDYIFTHAAGRLEYEFEKPITGFRASVCLAEQESSIGVGSVVFSVETSEGEVYRSKTIAGKRLTEEVEISFKPSTKLVLVVGDNGDDNSDWSLWLNPQYR